VRIVSFIAYYGCTYQICATLSSESYFDKRVLIIKSLTVCLSYIGCKVRCCVICGDKKRGVVCLLCEDEKCRTCCVICVDKKRGVVCLLCEDEKFEGLGTFVSGCYDGKVYVINRLTGVIYWCFETESQVKCSPCVDPKTALVYIGSHDACLYALDVQVKRVCSKCEFIKFLQLNLVHLVYYGRF